MFLPCRCRRRRRRICSWVRHRREGHAGPEMGVGPSGPKPAAPTSVRRESPAVRIYYMLCRKCVFATKHSSRARAAQVFFPPQGEAAKARAKWPFAGDRTNDHPYLHRLSTVLSTARGRVPLRPTNGNASLQFCDTRYSTRGSSNSAPPAIATMRSSRDGMTSAMPVKRPNAGRIAWSRPRTKQGSRADSPAVPMRTAGCR